MAELGKFPLAMETSYEVPHHMDIIQDSDKTIEQGSSPSTMAVSMNLFNNMDYCRMLLTRHYDQRPFVEMVCDA